MSAQGQSTFNVDGQSNFNDPFNAYNNPNSQFNQPKTESKTSSVHFSDNVENNFNENNIFGLNQTSANQMDNDAAA